jgi:hypothetical protein
MSDMAQVEEWDFDVWMELAQNDPEKFEALRAQAIERVIEGVGGERKLHLRRLQWRIDQVRVRSKTPMAATMAISRMMWDSFYDLRDQYQDLFGDETGGRRPVEIARPAKVLTFAPRTVRA